VEEVNGVLGGGGGGGRVELEMELEEGKDVIRRMWL